MLRANAATRVLFLAAVLVSVTCGIALAGPLRSPEGEFSFLERELLRRPGEPEALERLYRIEKLENLVARPGRIGKLCERLLKKKKLPFETRVLARWLLWSEVWKTGEPDLIRATREALGMMTRWRVIGPFDNEGGIGMDLAYGPERMWDPDAEYEGKVRPVKWRAFPGISRLDGYQSFKTVFTPSSQSVAYACGRVHSPKAMKAVLLLGAGGALRVWVNSLPAASWDEDRPRRRWQSAYRVQLKKGVNDILVKVGGREKNWGFRLSILDVKGRAIPALTGLDPSEGADRLAPFPNEARRIELHHSGGQEPLPMTAERLEARYKRRPDAKTALALRRLVFQRHAYSRERLLDEEWIERAMKLEADGREVLYTCGKFLGDHNRRLGCLMRGRELYPDDPRFPLELARFHYRENQFLKALTLLTPILHHEAVELSAVRLLSGLYNRRGWETEALHLLSGLVERYPGVRAAKLALAGQFDRLGRAEEANEIRRGLFLDKRNSTHLARRLYAYHHERREIDKALHYLNHTVSLNPGHLVDYMTKARLLEGQGRISEAKETLEEALSISPEETPVIERLAHLQHRLGQTGRAVALWRRSLEVLPQNPRLKRYLRLIEPEEKSFEQAYVRDAGELLALYPREADSGEDAEELFSQRVTKVFNNGLSSRFEQIVARVNTDTGVGIYRSFAIRFSPDRQEIKILKARIFKPDGEVIERYNEREHSIDQDFVIYFDNRVRTVSFPSLEPGDVVELQYRLDDVAVDNLFAEYFGAIVMLQGKIPIREKRVVVLMPLGKPLYTNSPGLAAGPEIIESENGREYIWRLKDVPKIKYEPNSPPLVEIADHLHVSTFRDWLEMGRWYWSLIKDQFIAKDELKEKVRELVKGVDDPLERVKIIHGWVITNTRYVGLEFGIHGYKPYQVNQIFTRRFGDCKDKATLMIAMLKEAGVNAWMAIIRTSNMGALEDYPPSLDSFNHAIIYLPDFDLYLDGTAEFAGPLELPYHDRRGQVMLLGENTVRHTVVPPSNPETNIYMAENTVSLNGSDAVAASRISVSGTRAAKFRMHFQDVKRRREHLEKLINRDHPGAELIDFDFGAFENLQEPVRFQYTARLPEYVRKEGAGCSVRAGIDRVDLVKRFAGLSERTHPVEIDRLQTLVTTTVLELGGQYSVLDLPENREMKADFGTFEMTVAEEMGRVRISTRLAFTKNRISPGEYGEFRTFCQEVTQALNQEIRLAHVSN